MIAALVLYPGFTSLDAVGPASVLAFAPGWQVVLTAQTPGHVPDDRGVLGLHATTALDDLAAPDVIIVPGGPGTLAAMGDDRLLAWLASRSPRASWTTSVCSGSFVLAAAGLLDGRRATSHWGWSGLLYQVGAVPVEDRVVRDGPFLTAAGVSAGIDMALTLLGLVDGDVAAQTVQLALEYDPRPPYAAGRPATAPAALLEPALQLLGVGLPGAVRP